jgi:hypothetical protein
MARAKKAKTGDVSLRHTIWKEGERVVHFYDGQLIAKDGVVTIPSDNPAWIRRAWILGYRLDPETNEDIRIEDIIDINA